jgi:ABC-type lipoprotein export system ATPase subunit
MSTRFRKFTAENILGDVSYKLDVSSDTTIIVGPNGTGKSTFLNVFYLFITRQWTRLMEYNFSKLALELDTGEVISLSKTDLLSAETLGKMPGTVRNYINRLSSTSQLQTFISSRDLAPAQLREIADTLKIPREEVQALRSYLTHRVRDIETPYLEVERRLADLELEKVLYLPTYRRIEKDLKSIFPDIEERLRMRLSDNPAYARQGKNFAEIVSFGMEDIARIISDFTAKLNSVAKNKSNAAAQEYIRDMVRGEIKNYSIGPIRYIDPEAITQFVNRLDDQLLSGEDKARLRSDIEKLRKRNVGKPSKDMQYLGFFVEKMLNVYLDLQREEAPLLQFTNVIQKYFSNKAIRYNNYTLSITDLNGNKIEVDDLSSGEKQILSIFAYLLLTQDQSYLVFIDEPELSLSVPWQKTFLPDIIDTARCKYLFAVSHSPFVFDNELRSSIIDVRKLRVENDGAPPHA